VSEYVYVRDGAIAPPPPQTIWAQGRAWTRNPFPRPYAVGAVRIAAEAPDAELAALGCYLGVLVPRGQPPGLAYLPTTGAPVVDVAAGTVTVTEGWRAMSAEELADALAAAKRAKLDALAAEAETRLAAVNPWVDSIDAYQVLQAVILTIRAEARNPVPALLLAIKAVADAGKAARTAIQALTTLEAVAAYDVAADPGWP
jgi:hypothetical protein